MTDLLELVVDLDDEHQALEAVVAGLTDEQWRLPTPSPGWSVADQIGHLTYFDDAAAIAIADPDTFKASAHQLLGSGDIEARTLLRELEPGALLKGWRTGWRRLREVAQTLDDDARIPWYGPSMGAKSFVTARLMEYWAHGQDIVDAVGVPRPATARLRHIAQLGYLTRAWSYANRGLEPPPEAVRLELTAPSGEIWRFGPDDAAAVVTGSAVDFCLVVTQRRRVDDTALELDGDAARDWLLKAQAFAGPPTEGPAPRGA